MTLRTLITGFLFFFFSAIPLFGARTPFFGSGTLFVELGPEIYHMCRWREGGTHQTGQIGGVRLDIERFKGNSWYACFDALYSNGKLSGNNAAGLPLTSIITDTILEGRLGYTFQQECRGSFITLYGGYGSFNEKNNFFSPSPIPFHFNDSFNYAAAGFLSGVNFTPLLSMGLNFEVRFMLNGKSEVSNDPLFEDVSLIMNNETHYRLEIPLTCVFCNPCNKLTACVVPFYEFRHFGGREGFPFDFIDTKFSLFGARLSFAYRF